MELITDLGKMLTGVATAVISVLMYCFAIYSWPIGSYDLSFIAWSPIAIIAWVICALLSGYKTQHRDLYFVTCFVSLGVAVAVTGVLAYVVLIALSGDPHPTVQDVLAIAGAKQLLIALFAFAWFDFLYVESHKWHQLRDGEKRAAASTVGAGASARPAAREEVVVPVTVRAAETAQAESAEPSGEITRPVDLEFYVKRADGTKVPLRAQ